MDKISGKYALITVSTLLVLSIIFEFFSPEISGGFFCLFLLTTYYALALYVLKICKLNIFEIICNEKKEIFLIVLIFTLFTAFEVFSAETVRVWDSVTYWEASLYSRELFLNSPSDGLKELLRSIDYDDYNKFTPTLLVFPMLVFGKSYAAYALSVWFFFALPAVLITSCGAKKILKQFNVNLSAAKILFIMLLIPSFEFPFINGYDHAPMLISGALISLLLLSSSTEKIDLQKITPAALLADISVIQTRTAAYTVIGCFAGYAAYIIYSSVTKGRFKEQFATLVKKYLYMFVVCFAILYFFFNHFLQHALFFDLKTAYVAYTLGQDYFERIFSHIVFIGILPYGIYIISLIFALKNKSYGKYAAFSAIWIAVSVFAFCRIQVMGQQHQYIALLPIILAIALFVAYNLKNRPKIGIAIIILLTINFFNAQLGFLPKCFGPVNTIDIRGDIDDLKDIVADLNNLSKEKHGKIYFISSSGPYNSGTLQKINMPEQFNAMPNLLWTPDIDLRDGFSADFFDADIIALVDPVQIHLLPEYQRDIVYLYETMTGDNKISRHFKEIKNYKLSPYKDTQVTFRVFEKVSPIEKSDIDFLEKRFVDSYPNNNKLFKDVFEKYKAEHFK